VLSSQINTEKLEAQLPLFAR